MVNQGRPTTETDPRDARISELEAENARLRTIRDALIARVESGSAPRPAPYAAFEHSVVLAEQVRERTEALNQTMDQLKASNLALETARQSAETASQRLIDAIESVDDGFVLFDHNHRVVLTNSRFRSFWEDPEGSIVPGMSIVEVKRLAVATGLVVEEHRDQQTDGVIYRLSNGLWVQVSEHPTREGGLVILYSDITGIKNSEDERRERALAEKSRLLQSAVDNLSQGVVLVNPEGRPDIWNQRFVDLNGFVEEQISRQSSFRELMGQSRTPFLSPRVKLDDGQPCWSLEHHSAEGRVLEIRTHPVSGGGYVNTYTDITERYQYAETLRESERWIRLVTDHVPALIAYVGDDLTVQFCNKVYRSWYDMDGKGVLGRSLHEIHPLRLYHRLLPHIRTVLLGESVTFEFEEEDRHGRSRFMLRSYVPNHDESGQVVGFFVLIRDVTERRKTAQALQEAYDNLEQRVRERTAELTALNNKLRSEIQERALIEERLREAKREAEQANLSKTKFLAAVSHDLLQPLNAARLFTSSLMEESFGLRAEELVRSVSSSLDDVENLLGTLVDISKLDAGVIKPDVNAFDLRDLLNNIAREFQQMASRKDLSLDFVPSSGIVQSDPQLLARILRNFLTNAIRYTEHGRILLGVRRRADTLVIQVWDTGPGIPRDKLKEIFQEFKRVSPARGAQAQDRGLGLGLAIVDKIARMLGHPVTVDSREDKGSVFSVTLPKGALVHSETDQPPGASMPMGIDGLRLWIVDNDPAICEGMRILLEGWGCQVVTALSLADLEEQVDVASESVDALLADYHLDNGENGLDLVGRINASRCHPLPVIMLTANYTNDLKQAVREQGHALMNKPIKPLRLRSLLTHLLISQRPER